MLQRRKPLQQKTPLASRKTRIAPVSKRAQKRTSDWTETVKLVRIRSAGRCEACHRPCASVDPHHVMKRERAGIPREIADSPELIAGICRACHDFCEQHPRSQQQRALEWLALSRFARRAGVDLNREYCIPGHDFEPWTPLQILRDIIRKLPPELEVAA